METRANYALIGIFTLAVIASAFGFVLWFAGGDKAGGQRTFKVVFVGSVSGLLRGAPVLFNGVRIGEVTKIDFMPDDPGHVYALVDVDARVPVRADTRARLEATGLTGVASVALSGGTGASPPLQSGPGGGPPMITADRSDFQDLIETARRIAGQATEFLDKTNKVLDDNTGSITASVKNIQKFSDALAANSDGLKGLTAKLEGLAGDADNLVKAIDPAQVKSIISDFSSTSKSIRKLADDVDARWKDIGANLARFTGAGLREYEALASDGRKTLDQVNQAIRSIEQNPQQFIFGKKQQIPEYTGAR
jgi:phospholipid/cholesterol/gamma-HCH transport system substrate-binding protein